MDQGRARSEPEEPPTPRTAPARGRASRSAGPGCAVRHCVSCSQPIRPNKAISRSNRSKMAREKQAASCQNDDMASSTRIGSHALATLLPALKSLGARRGAVYAALADALSSLVLDGRIAVGTRVPSERELAAALGLSRTTVTAAYSALRADGYLISRT